MTIPTGFVKSTIHASGEESSRTRSAISQHDGNRPKRLREAAGTGRLLTDAAAGERDGLVREARLLAADADLDQDEVGAVERAVEVAGHLQLAGVALPLQHPRGEAADHVAPLLVDVVQDELAHVDLVALPREPRDELGRVRRAAADDRDLHPLFTPVRVTPSTNARCARKKRISTGSITRIVAAITRFHCTWCSERNWESPIEMTQLSWFSPT